MTEEIRFFIREEPYGFLSNFDRTGFLATAWGIEWWYPTNEHYYQAQKANCREMHNYIKNAPHARVAMVLGRQLEHNKYLKDKYMKKNWDEEKKKGVMLTGIRCKFASTTTYPIHLGTALLETGNAILHEDNPEDFYWAIADGTGISMLGKLLMQVREEIKTSRNNGGVRTQ